MFRFYTKSSSSKELLPKNRKRREQDVRITVVASYQDGILKTAVARCGRKDHFIRSMGRKIAEQRLQQGYTYNTYSIEGDMTTEKFIEIATQIAKEIKTSPERVTESIKKSKQLLNRSRSTVTA